MSPKIDVTIGAGEAVIYVDNQVAQTARNTGDTTARAISVGGFSTSPPSARSIGAVSTEDWERSGLAGHNLLIRVERLASAAGGEAAGRHPGCPCAAHLRRGRGRGAVGGGGRRCGDPGPTGVVPS